jgi:hypothetical protein
VSWRTLVEPLSIISPETVLEGTPSTSSKVKKVSKLLSDIKMYVAKVINKQLNTILEAWEVGTNLRIFSQLISFLIDYIQQDLENVGYVYKNEMSTFTTQVLDMNDLTRKQQDLRSNNIMKQIKVGWLARIEFLRELIATCKNLEVKRTDSFLKSLDIVKELEGPPLIR